MIFLLDFCVRNFTVGCLGVWEKLLIGQRGFIDHLSGIFEIDLRTKYDNFDAQSIPTQNWKWITMKTKGSPKVIRDINIKIITQKKTIRNLSYINEKLLFKTMSNNITRTEKAQKMRNWNRLFNWIQHVFPIFYRNFFQVKSRLRSITNKTI